MILNGLLAEPSLFPPLNNLTSVFLARVRMDWIDDISLWWPCR